jgi:hypothetical protein
MAGATSVARTVTIVGLAVGVPCFVGALVLPNREVRVGVGPGNVAVAGRF